MLFIRHHIPHEMLIKKIVERNIQRRRAEEEGQETHTLSRLIIEGAGRVPKEMEDALQIRQTFLNKNEMTIKN